MKILADATLLGLKEAFPKPFELTLYQQPEEILSLLKGHQVLLCRSTLTVNETLLKGHTLDCVATASSGVDHIEALYLQKNSIKLIDAKGSNATAVADYVIATLAFLQKYNGFSGAKAGVIGLGEVGSKVVKRLAAAQMEVLYYDPPRRKLSPHFCNSSLASIAQCDLISVHANLHDRAPYASRNLLNETVLSQLKPQTVIINASRGGIVNEEALLKQRNSLVYCTDVYENEPAINQNIIDFATLCTPHIAGHSVEAKYTAVAMVSEKLHLYYKLPPPTIRFPVLDAPPLLSAKQSWQDCVLSLYNPIHETHLLKSATHLKSTFLDLRKSHQNRHNFSVYDAHLTDEQTHRILGK